MNEKVKVFCNRCNTTTNHTVLCEHKVDEILKDQDNQSHHLGTFSYQIIQCNGCESISYRSVTFFNQFFEFDESKEKPVLKEEKEFETYFPERRKNLIAEKQIIGLPFLIRKAYQEVIQCYNFDLRILCSAGLRATIEGICNHLDIKGKTLGDRIDTLSKNGLLSEELSKSLHSHKFLGNYALHRLEMAEKDELNKAIELLEWTMEMLFGVPGKRNELSKLITKRVSE